MSSSSGYGEVRSGKLQLKGGKDLIKKKKKKRRHSDLKQETKEIIQTEGWVMATEVEDLEGPIFIISPSLESLQGNSSLFHCVASTNTGSIILKPVTGEDYEKVEPVEVDQVFVIHPLSLSESSASKTFTLRTPDGNYLSCDQFGMIAAPSSAMGPQEQWEVVLKEDGIAFQNSANGKFLTVDSELGELRGDGESVGYCQVFKVKCQAAIRAKRFKKVKKMVEKNEDEIELENAKKFQAWGGGRVKLNSEDKKELFKAKEDGKFNEALLDRRAKVKSDRYCK